MLRIGRAWCGILGVSLLLTACQNTDNTEQTKKRQSAASSKTVLSQAVAYQQKKDDGLRSVRQVAGKQNTKSKMSGYFPTLDDRYTMLFDINSNGLNQAYQGELVLFAEYLGKNKDVKIHVEGYTCELGSAEYNVALGQRRAFAVSKFLESKGVDPSQIILVSYGKERPADPEHNEVAWMKNRRVEVYF